ncbi:MAG: hypothetical protein ACI9R3_004755 [Verrucomicrobiales bacterium]|jgi:hypothetical protein
MTHESLASDYIPQRAKRRPAIFAGLLATGLAFILPRALAEPVPVKFNRDIRPLLSDN